MFSLFSRFTIGCIALALGVALLLIVPMNDVQRALCAILAIVPVALFPASVWGVMLFAAAVVDFSLTTGWQFFSEFDAVVLIALGVAYLRTIMEKPVTIAPPLVSSLFVTVCFVFLFASLRVWRHAPAWDANALNNVLSPWFAVYQGKPYLYALLFLPILSRTAGSSGRRVGWSIVAGSWFAMFVMSILALWERHTFPGILNFASDYRITTGNSSMHTGSGALDAMIVLAFPAAMVLLFDRRAWLQVVGALSFPLFAYTAFVTFSRGLQLGLIAGIGSAAVAYWFARRPVRRTSEERSKGFAQMAVLAVAFAVALGLLLWMFPTSGYRGALALCSTFFALFLAFARPSMSARNYAENARLQRAEWFAIGCGIALALGALVFAGFIKKLPYLLHGTIFVGCVFTSLWALLSDASAAKSVRFIAQVLAVALLGTTVSVAVYWGEHAAAFAVMASALITLVGLGTTRTSALAWSASRERTIGFSVAMLCVAGLAAGLNSSFLKTRTAGSTSDLQVRANHWRDALALGSETLSTTLLGHGTGRFFTEYATRAPRDKPGNFWWSFDGAGGRIRLVAGKYKQGYGEVLRLGQRVTRPTQQPYNVVLHVVPNVKPAVVEVTLCEKLLLTSGECGVVRLNVPAASTDTNQAGFLELKAPLSPLSLSQSKLWRPYVATFGLETNGTQMDILSIQIFGRDAQDILQNGDFHAGMNHWFHSTDNFHLPWHTHNWAIGVWFDAGVVGLMSWLLLLVGALVAVWTGLYASAAGGSRLRIAAIAGGVTGAMAVGLVDSLTDIPRVTFWLLLLCACLVAMCTRQRAPKNVSETFTLTKRSRKNSVEKQMVT